MSEGLTTIGAGAFSGCTSLTSITIPATIESIGQSAFEGCSQLSDIYLYAIEPPVLNFWKSVYFYGIPDTCVLYVPQGSKEKYEEATVWKEFAPISEFETTAIESVFGTESLSSFTCFPNLVTDGFKVSGFSGTAKLELYSLSGKKLLIYTCEENTYIPVGELPNGLYTVRLTTKAGTTVRKIIKKG